LFFGKEACFGQICLVKNPLQKLLLVWNRLITIMGIGKSLSLTLILILIMTLSRLAVVGTVHAQTSTKPAKPDFTINIQNETVVLTIENQPFDVHNSYNYSFFYDVRIINIEGYWSSFYTAEEEYPTQSTSNQTILYYTIGESDYFPSVTTLAGIAIPANGQATFQVMAMTGYWEKEIHSDGSISYGLKGEVSGWSDSQRIVLPSANTSSPAYYVSPEGKTGTSYKLMVFSPNDQITYKNVLHLAFMLRWSYVPMPMGGELEADYEYSIDDGPFVSIVPNQTSNDRYAGGTNFVYNPSFSYLLDISNLTNGHHEIVIKACFYYGFMGLRLNASSRPFPFVVEGQTPTTTVTPSPSSTSTPTETPFSTPTPTASPEPTATEEPFPTSLVFVASVGVAVVAISLLVYFKKRHRDLN
jgi:hypothetical protein